jgi:hypothetical protein
MPFTFNNLLPFDEHSRGDARRRARRWPARVAAGLGAVSLIGLAVLAGCGGGGGDSAASGSTSTSSGASTTTTASAAAVTEGTITGFGSVIVNGVRFDSDSCTVVDDTGATVADTSTTKAVDKLKLGMRVEVSSGSVDSSTSSAKAVKISFGSRVVGPVGPGSLVDSKTLSVLGQTIDIVDATVFGSSTLLADIGAGTVTVVEVHGLPDAATGHILATRLDAPASVSEYKLRGAITALDPTAKTLSIGATSISYAAATLAPTTLALATGLVVRVTLPTTLTTASTQPYAATRLSAPGKAGSTSTTPLAAHVRGTVAGYDASAKTFTLDGLKIDASAVTTLPTTLADGIEVDVVGSVSNSVLVATAVTLKAETRGHDGKRFELHGAITAIDTTAKTFTLRGITVNYGGSVSYLPSGKAEADLAVGAKVEVMGSVGSTRTTVVASTIQFES